MIKKTLIGTLLVLLLYHALITYCFPTISISRHQWQDNVIKAQKYLFSTSPYKNIIVGSSLSCRLPADSILDFYNLSFSGQSLFDGLSIILGKADFPQRVFIETNIILRKENNNFTSTLKNPLFFYSRKYMPCLREDKQPLAIASVPVVKALYYLSGISSRLLKPHNRTSLAVADTNLFKNIVQHNIKHNSIPPDPHDLEVSFTLLKQYIDRLEENNVEVIFYEMPVSPSLNQLIVPETVRREMLQVFPRTKYKYIDQPDCTNYITTDGAHLTEKEAATYVHYFKESAARL